MTAQGQIITIGSYRKGSTMIYKGSSSLPGIFQRGTTAFTKAKQHSFIHSSIRSYHFRQI